MKHYVSQKLFSYWNRLRGNRIAPRRLDIEPGCIGSLLPDTFILERNQDDSFSYRLAGTHVCEIFGKELRGGNFLAGWNLTDIKTLISRLNAISIQGGAALFTLEFQSVFGDVLLAEMLLLPLLHREVFADRYLGSLSLFERPIWLKHESIVNRKLISDQMFFPTTEPPIDIQIPKKEETNHNFIRKSRLIIKKNRTFRVIDGGRSEEKSLRSLDPH